MSNGKTRMPRKADLVERLAQARAKRYPDLYAGHLDHARYFASHQYPTLDDLMMACFNQGLLTDDEKALDTARRYRPWGSR